MTDQLKVMTYNAAFLPYLSKKYFSRLPQFAHAVAQQGADIICLQEIWADDAKEFLKEKFKQFGYFHHAMVTSKIGLIRGILGNGLLVLSKYPIVEEVEFVNFKTFTRIDEFFAGKGAMKVVVEVGAIGKVEVYSTHLGAVSFNSKLGTFSRAQIERLNHQLQDFKEFVVATASRIRPVLILGDFNFHPMRWLTEQRSFCRKDFSPEYLSIVQDLSFSDAAPIGVQMEGPQSLITYDPRSNPLNTGNKLEPASRLDHIYYRVSDRIQNIEIKLAMDGKAGHILSDHYALIAQFKLF